jgi:NAD-dependent dihydropyrimidine dehydrogenase PreA subunit
LPAPTQKWLPVVDWDLCDGCGACVEACGPRSLELHDGLAVLVSPQTCGSEEHCIEPCHSGAIRMAWRDAAGDTSLGRWR